MEALAALAAWTERYDSGEWDDPPGKLALLYDLERVGALLRDGNEPFDPDRDRLAFARHLIEIGCQPPPARGDDRTTRRRFAPIGEGAVTSCAHGEREGFPAGGVGDRRDARSRSPPGARGAAGS